MLSVRCGGFVCCQDGVCGIGMLLVRCLGYWYAVSKVYGGLVCCQYGVWGIGTLSVRSGGLVCC